jgi:hypothetical protein
MYYELVGVTNGRSRTLISLSCVTIGGVKKLAEELSIKSDFFKKLFFYFKLF